MYVKKLNYSSKGDEITIFFYNYNIILYIFNYYLDLKYNWYFWSYFILKS